MLARLWSDRRVRWIAVVAWMGVIFFFSAQSKLPDLTGGHPQLEEVGGHLAVYAVLALLVQRALAGSGVRHAALWALVFAFVYGISDEFHQAFVPGRHPDPVDVATDLAGAAAALSCQLSVVSYRFSPRPGHAGRSGVFRFRSAEDRKPKADDR